MRRIIGAVCVLGLLVAACCVAGVLASARGRTAVAQTIPACPAASPVTVGQIVVPRGPIAGFCQAQLVNAAQIMTAARARGIGVRTQAVGVMTAIGESRLRNLSYGDAAGPDSRGIFQQRDNGAWGTLADRMDPYTASVNFFLKLTSVDGWRTMAPTRLAHVVQGNADPDYYARFWPEAQTIVGALAPAPSPAPTP
ncbi:MAG TPA: hypothetical protein VGC45_01035 [Gryllotalpicola sp.]